MGPLELAGVTLMTFLVIYLIAWGVCTMIKDVTPIDGVWPTSLVVAALIGLLFGQATEDRRGLMLAVILLWGLRLAFHMWSRWWREGEEDPRYGAMRAENPATFAARSLPMIFGLQAVASFVVSFPILAGAGAAPDLVLNRLDDVGILILATGLFIEAFADHQLTRFRRNPDNHGKILDTGLWRWSRHPNYLGEIIFWWGVWLLAAGTGIWGLVAIISPLLMTGLLLFGSGIPMLEKRMAEKEGWAAYAARTAPLIPGLRIGRRPTAN